MPIVGIDRLLNHPIAARQFFLSHNVIEPGQCDAFGANANAVAQRGHIRSDDVEKSLRFIDNDRPDRLVRPVVDQLPQMT